MDFEEKKRKSFKTNTQKPWKYIWKKTSAIEPTDLLNPHKAMREDKNTAEKLNDFFALIFTQEFWEDYYESCCFLIYDATKALHATKSFRQLHA